MGCSVGMGIGQGAVRHMTQWALLVWSVTQVWVPGHTTLEHDSAKCIKMALGYQNVQSSSVKTLDIAYFCTLLGTWLPGLGVPYSGPLAGHTRPCRTCHRCRTQHASWECESSLGRTRTEAFPTSSYKPCRDCISLPHMCLGKHKWAVCVGALHSVSVKLPH